jgi:hypothetical protein
MTTDNAHDRLHDKAMTWAALLGKWAEFARSAVALPDDGDEGRLKKSVPDIIALQSITHALAEIDELDADERALGLDRAEIGIREHASAINAIYAGEPMPEALTELIEDARLALAAASGGGLEWTVASESLLGRHPATLVSILIDAGFKGDLFMPTPGVPLFATSPACFIRQPDGGPIDEELLAAIEFSLTAQGAEIDGPTHRPEPRQVYRQFDFSKGGPVRDYVVPMKSDLPAGQPLLVPAILAGEPQAVTLPVPGADRQPTVPVEFA